MATEPHLLDRSRPASAPPGVAGLGGPDPQPRLHTDGRTVVALRRAQAIAPGQLRDRTIVDGTRLVGADDPDGTSWWIPADTVWCDGEAIDAPEHPRRIGLATAPNHAAAVVHGLSDRLGWEAVHLLDQGGDLPTLPLGGDLDPEHFVLLDGRLGHGVPTVVVLGADVTCWGAGSTWERALHRAIYGAGAVSGAPSELASLVTVLAEAGLRPVTVDLGSSRLRAHGIVRTSVQLVAAP